ncbi:MAG: hypothetical protein GY778_30895 [bacterium]|nr:hypothetical protein [bacterium]
MTVMPDVPRFLCPQCGCSLRARPGSTCPDCGFLIDATRTQYRGAVRHWRFLRGRHRLEYLVILWWLVVAGAVYRVIAWSPPRAVIVLTFIAAILMLGLGQFLILRRRRRS